MRGGDLGSKRKINIAPVSKIIRDFYQWQTGRPLSAGTAGAQPIEMRPMRPIKPAHNQSDIRQPLAMDLPGRASLLPAPLSLAPSPSLLAFIIHSQDPKHSVT